MSESDEYQTPRAYVIAARLVMNGIELDPATSLETNERLRIPNIFTKYDSAFNYSWFGNIWLNPPYSKPNLTNWTKYLVNEWVLDHFRQSIYLIPAFTSEKWFQPLFLLPICFTNHRIQFLLENKIQDQPRFSNAFVYFGKTKYGNNKFAEVFSKFGTVIRKF
jgi:hypothetical protein